MDQYYTTGEFARMAHVTIRTIRYYDKKGLLKPSFINESGYRMYSDEDFLKLQKILSLKYLGFSLNEIGNMTIHDTSADILKSLKMQIGLVHKKMENLEQMEKALQNTTQILEETNQIDWTGILNLIHLTDMEKMLVEQYKNGENQWGTRKSPEVDVYNSMIKNYTSVIKQINDILPDAPPGDDELTAFLKGKGGGGR